MPSLSYSMTKDPSLRAAVKKLVLDSPELSASDFRAAVGEILVKWAGAEGVSPDSNGPYIDARNVKVVEKVGGTELAFSTVDAHWSGWIKGMYDHILDQYTDLFMIESFSSYFSQSEATTDQIARHQYRYLATMLVKPDDNTVWVNKGLFIDYAMLDLHLQGLDPVASLRSSSGNIALMNGLKVLNDLTGSGLSGPGMFLGQQPGLLWSGDNREAVSRTLLACMMSGTQLQNIEFGSGQAETIKLDYSSVVGFGDLGDDVILGSGADDVILGGGGNDLLAGGAGNDSYIWFHGDGNDVIDERVYGDGDKLILSGVKSGDISFLRADGDITLVVSASTPGGTDGGSVKLLNIDPQWNESVDTIVLADATWSLADLRAKFLLAAATTGNDYITGFKGNDLMIGGAGDDTLTGGAGADTLSGGAGNDMLIGGDGPDTFIWNRGDGQDEILGGGYFDSDTLVLKGVTEQQVILRLVNDALTIVIQPSSATSTDGGSVSIGSNATVVFDNATWTGDQLSARFYALQASPGADLITGTSGNDSILGGGGTPSLSRACSALLEASAGHRLAA